MQEYSSTSFSSEPGSATEEGTEGSAAASGPRNFANSAILSFTAMRGVKV
jgi:hypothetical protein